MADRPSDTAPATLPPARRRPWATSFWTRWGITRSTDRSRRARSHMAPPKPMLTPVPTQKIRRNSQRMVGLLRFLLAQAAGGLGGAAGEGDALDDRVGHGQVGEAR